MPRAASKAMEEKGREEEGLPVAEKQFWGDFISRQLTPSIIPTRF